MYRGIDIIVLLTLFQTISKDSDSLITEGPENGYDPSMPWWQHPKVRENWKMVLAAFSLLLIGLGTCCLFTSSDYSFDKFFAYSDINKITINFR